MFCNIFGVFILFVGVRVYSDNDQDWCVLAHNVPS
ncbi:Uncharacterised protein [Grimontia hollisae]|uniref:Uncharacterized protein n=1 Tax=Grimontia hollisae TaxID=673 RepID=A0A377HPH3_GRIHO|nr:Uncharacterised protein [Grimontia hollisae]STO58046.1 Uncharacterised protein [Grimontia hollisae]STQ76557.1 Uncharacterised protein [Grimontia hollisae]